MKAYKAVILWGISSLFKVGTQLKRVVSFAGRPLYPGYVATVTH